MDVLVSMGTNAAYIYSIISIVQRRQQYTSTGKDVGGSDFFETAALLITFISLGKLLESRAKGKTSEVCRWNIDLFLAIVCTMEIILCNGCTRVQMSLTDIGWLNFLTLLQ